jgi:hypothetical protein
MEIFHTARGTGSLVLDRRAVIAVVRGLRRRGENLEVTRKATGWKRTRHAYAGRAGTCALSVCCRLATGRRLGAADHQAAETYSYVRAWTNIPSGKSLRKPRIE